MNISNAVNIPCNPLFPIKEEENEWRLFMTEGDGGGGESRHNAARDF